MHWGAVQQVTAKQVTTKLGPPKLVPLKLVKKRKRIVSFSVNWLVRFTTFTSKYGNTNWTTWPLDSKIDDSSGFECDWLKECVPQNWVSDTKCDTMQLILYGQTLVKFIFKSNLWHNMSFVSQFSLNLANFEMLGSLLPHDQLHSILTRNFEEKPNLRYCAIALTSDDVIISHNSIVFNQISTILI